MEVSIGDKINRKQLNHQALLCVKKPHQIFKSCFEISEFSL